MCGISAVQNIMSYGKCREITCQKISFIMRRENLRSDNIKLLLMCLNSPFQFLYSSWTRNKMFFDRGPSMDHALKCTLQISLIRHLAKSVHTQTHTQIIPKNEHNILGKGLTIGEKFHFRKRQIHLVSITKYIN